MPGKQVNKADEGIFSKGRQSLGSTPDQAKSW